MSVTFYMPGKQDCIPLRNKDYNPNKPEDPIMNPMLIEAPLYPFMTLANFNATRFLLEVGLWSGDVGDLVGKIEHKDLRAFISKMNELEKKFPSHSKMGTYFDRLDRLARTALYLNEDLCWS